MKCIIGVGKAYQSIGGLADSYQQACKAVDYKLINNKSGVIFFNAIDAISSTSYYYYYPIDKELEIINGLRRGNVQETMKVVDKVLEMNIHNELTLNQGRHLFYDLTGTFLKVLNDLELNDAVVIEQNIFSTVATVSEMHSFLVEMCEAICDLIKNNKASQHQILKLNILKYIDEQFDDSNLSLESVSAYVEKSAPYVSKFFKEHIGCNFLDYLNRKRITKAKELLNGQMTVIEIASLVGYNNDITFRRVFKKYENMTPSEYILAKDS